MSRQLSTALSDLMLAMSAVWSFVQLKQSEQELQFGKWWFMLQTIAASLGVLKFGRFAGALQESVDRYHKNFSWLSAAVGVPCLGAQCCQLYGYVRLSQAFLISAVVTFTVCTRKSELKDVIPLITAPVIIFTIIFLGYSNENFNLCYAGLLFILTGAIGDEGKLPGTYIQNVDMFHYLLVAVNVFSVRGILYP